MQADFLLAQAQAFGTALDLDDFRTALSLLAETCTYDIGEEILKGPKAIVSSYESNMLEGRKKLDELVWGESTVEWMGDLKVAVYFTDYLKHKGKSHIHKCRQVLSFDELGKIVHIEHQNLPGEPEKLKAFYQTVGLGKEKE